MVFPDGRLPSRRWRPVVLALACFGILRVVAWALAQDHIDGDPTLPVNPLGRLLPQPLPYVVIATAGLLLIACTVAAIISLFGRLRRSTGIERAQYQ